MASLSITDNQDGTFTLTPNSIQLGTLQAALDTVTMPFANVPRNGNGNTILVVLPTTPMCDIVFNYDDDGSKRTNGTLEQTVFEFEDIVGPVGGRDLLKVGAEYFGAVVFGAWDDRAAWIAFANGFPGQVTLQVAKDTPLISKQLFSQTGTSLTGPVSRTCRCKWCLETHVDSRISPCTGKRVDLRCPYNDYLGWKTDLCRPRKDGTAGGELLTRSQFMTENCNLIKKLIIRPLHDPVNPVPFRRLALVVENANHPMGRRAAYPTLITGFLIGDSPHSYMKIHVGQFPGDRRTPRRAQGPTSPTFRSPQKRRSPIDMGPNEGVEDRETAIQNDAKFDALLFVPSDYQADDPVVADLINGTAIRHGLTRIMEDKVCRVYFFPEHQGMANHAAVSPHIKCALCNQMHTPGLFCTNDSCPKGFAKYVEAENRFRS